MSPAMSGGNSGEAVEPPVLPPEKPVEVLLSDVLDPNKREEAFHDLSKRRQTVPDFALLIWHTPCIITLILQEIIRIYPYIGHPSNIPACDSYRVCSALSLLQVVAADTRVRSNFIKANIPQYLYPFMLADYKSRTFEFLRLTSLGVIGSLIREEDMEVILFLIQSEIVPACLRSMDVGTELSKTTATLIMQKILSTDLGLSYMCDKADRFFAMHQVLASMVKCTEEKPTARLLKHVISCYLLVSNHPRVADCLYEVLPDIIKDGTVYQIFKDDAQTIGSVQKLLWNIKGRHGANGTEKAKEKAKA